MTENKCDTCLSWHKYFDGDDRNQALGDCMRHPPSAENTLQMVTPTNEEIRPIHYHRGLFPTTSALDYCGEHELTDEAISDRIKIDEAREKLAEKGNGLTEEEKDLADADKLTKIMKDD